MTSGALAYLIVQGALFALWAGLMFRALFGLTRRSLAAIDPSGGGFFSWFRHNLRLFFGYFSDPETARERRVLYGVTVALIAMTIGSVFVMGRG